MGHGLPIAVINLSNKPLELKLEGGGDNRSLAILNDLPVNHKFTKFSMHFK